MPTLEDDIAARTADTVPCHCCGNAAPRKHRAQEWGTCPECVDAACHTLAGSDGDQHRGSACPLRREVAA